MDAEQALSDLGVSGIADADSLRRAYLRKVRVHSPERDPEGFKRVRNAYDFLRHKPWLWESAGGGFSEIETGSGEPALEPTSTPEPAEEAPAIARTEPVEAVEHPPAAPPARDPTPPPEPAELGRAEHGPVLSELFQKWIDVHDAHALEDPERTARAMIDLFNARIVERETPLPAPDTTFAVILALVERDLNRTAADLLFAFEARSRLEGSSPYAFSPATAARHKLIRELIALRGLAPKRLTRMLARMIREERPLQPSGDEEDATLLVGPGFREAFASRAPTLFAAAQPVLFKPTAKSSAPHGLTRVGWWVMFAVVLQVIRMVPNCTSASRSIEDDSANARVARAREPVAASLPSPRFEDLQKDIDIAIADNNCVVLGDLWSSYARAFKALDDPAHARASDFIIRKAHAAAACPDLVQTLWRDP